MMATLLSVTFSMHEVTVFLERPSSSSNYAEIPQIFIYIYI